MARVRTVEFLPEIFQTSTNQQFLAATLDQLVQEPSFKKVQGFVGRRTGPGVNPDDHYVVETSAVRADYQLEPGVVVTDADGRNVLDAITYPGINDALKLQGADTTNADRLYTSEYYTWDPFVDFDKFVNFSQYYWVPGGPDAVDVFADAVPLTDNFTVTRANGSYTFSGVQGTNPSITLVRGGNYTFDVAQNSKETVNFRVTNDSSNAYIIDYQPNPTLELVRGNTYIFNLILSGIYPFYIKTQETLGTTNVYNGVLSDGSPAITNNGASEGNIIFTVPEDAPDTLYYVNPIQPNLRGTINIVNAQAGTGPGFWIQTDPGVNGRIPATPNISSRDVLGVSNNGEDLGTVYFDVPQSTAQNFYYSLTPIGNIVSKPPGTVDFITSLKFDEINNIYVDQFDGIDGVLPPTGSTVVFLEQQADPEAGGWLVTTQFDPLPNQGNVVSGTGSFDSTVFDQTTVVPADERYGVWQIQYITTDDGRQYMKLNYVLDIENLEKFTVRYGQVYSSTQWYKDASSQIVQIPLLTATLNTLYYQDGTDPEIFGRIKLIEQDQSDTLDIDEIIGRKNYTSPNGVTFTNGLKVQFIGAVTPATYQNNSYYVEGVGTAIKLLPVTDFVTPETYTENATVPYDSTPYDVGNYDASLNQPLRPDYLTINRASPDLNAWTRSNRWFHIDVINASATYNNTVAVIDNNFRAKRPILEYRAGTRLYKFGTQGKQPVDIIDFSETDALSNINGTTGYSINGYNFVNGTRVIFAADVNPEVRDQIYVVEFISPDSVAPLIDEPIINLVPASDADVLINQTVVCLSGNTLQGKSFYYDGVEWLPAQDKTKINQAPLFDVYDSAGVSFSNRLKYPSTNFTGSKLFSYATVSGTVDPVLGFALKYLSLSNVGDIVFDNNLYTDTFTYTKDSVSTTSNVSLGFVRQYSDRVNFIKELGWQPAVTKSITRQQFRFVYEGKPLVMDVAADETTPLPALQLYVAGVFIDPSDYTYTVTNNTTVLDITVIDEFGGIGDVIEINIISKQTSKVAFYEVPVNLENNPLNVNSPSFTLGTARAHYGTIGENLKTIVGPINGANNSRDLGNIIPYGTKILQQSSPLTLAGYFMRSKEYNIFNALAYNSREYEKFKAQLMDVAIRNDYTNLTVAEILTSAMAYINTGRTSINPFYWSDMLPVSSVYTQSTNTITPISTNVFDLTTTYDFTSSNYKGLLVYVNDRLLTIDYDYVVSADGPTLTILTTLAVGDVVKIQEYATTYGNFVPNTPTKLGLYPAFKPTIYLDTTYVNPTFIILGHDGSKTVAFGDFRDELLLEFETRIFNNLKIKSEIPLPVTEVIPGQFRTTDYTLSEINNILSADFLSWVGWNKLNYTQQDYIANNQFTWNYSAAGDLLSNINNFRDETPLPVGAWRGINQYFYDTVTPQTTPWEMLGFTQEPAWWAEVYGPAPYTRDNLVLWDDLELGRVADPVAPYIRPEYARPGLSNVIPTGPEGELLSPFESVVGAYDASQFQKSWVFGDEGPTEYTWRSSSSYPFAVMRLLALTRPAEFFALFADRDLYKFDAELDQYLYNGRYRLDANGIQVYGNGVSKASYIDWIIDYNQQLGFNSTDRLTTDLASLDVRLCYPMGAFSDKQYIQIYAERSSPNSLNSSLLLPDESYNLLLYKNQPFERVIYSSVIVQRVEAGWAVFGYSITNPYFEILASRTAGTKVTIAAGGTEVRVPNTYYQNVVQIPYGYVFTNTTVVVDFLLSYGALLERQGLVFDSRENGHDLNWTQMAQEFLYWANQGWAVGSVINLNPAATTLTAIKANAIVDSVVAQTPENLILDQNRTTLPVRDLVVDRQGNRFTISSLSSQTINFLDLQFTSYETLVVLDNVSIFSDLLYDPATGARQSRVNLVAAVSADWNGQLDAQGFILNNSATIRTWEANRKYAKGEIVIYKNNYWSAQTIVQPSLEFKYSDWVKSDYTKIQKGLLPNIPNKADQLANSYNVNQANLEQDQDLLSYGLIGFRKREYMTALNLDDVSQVNVYKQFLKDKGTIRSVRLLGNANLSKEVAEYDLFENWAIQRAVYGANANRSFIELRLNEQYLQADPSLVQVIQPDQHSDADQTILLENVWRESYKLPNTDIFPTTLLSSDVDVALPSAGYVNLDDVDITVFSLLGTLAFAPGVLDTIGEGTTIWAAKSNSYDWNVYRCNGVPGYISGISNNLNTTSTVTFTKAHGLSVSDLIIIRFVSDTVNNAYRVLAVPNASSIVIELDTSVNLTTNGICYRLQTMRVAQASDVVNLPYSTQLVPGALAWVDNNGNDQWTVLQKQSPFKSEIILPVAEPVTNSSYGTSIAQAQTNIIALVGAPGGAGAVYPYIRDQDNRYSQSPVLSLGTTGTQGYGNSLEIGNQVWAVAGASLSNSNQGYASIIYRGESSGDFEQRNVLVAPDQDFGPGEFGHSVTISRDERWMYISAPGNNKVYAYGRVDVEPQSVRYTTDGVSISYSFNNSIVINSSQPAQLIVTLNNKLLTLGLDYLISANTVVFTSPPTAGQLLILTRRQAQQLDRTVHYGVEQNTGASTTAGTGATFTVDNIRGTYNVSITAAGTGYAAVTTEYESTGSSGTTFNVTSTVGITLGMRVVNSKFTSGQTVAGIVDSNTLTLSAAPDSALNDGESVTFGDVLVIDAADIAVDDSEPNSPTSANDLTIVVTSVVDGGIVSFETEGSGINDNYVFLLTPYLYTATNIYSFAITVNGILQRPHIDYDFNVDSATDADSVVFNTIPPAGANIVASALTYFQYVDTLTVDGLSPIARFGSSVTTTTDGRQVIIGAMNDGADITHPRSGSAYAFDRSMTQYVITDPTTLTYALPAGYKDPVAVKLNNAFLTNTDQYVNGQFTVTGGNVLLSSSVALAVGDVLQLESNIFRQIQKIVANALYDEGDFGYVVDICPNNCSIYTGAPLDGTVLSQAGSVQRNVNQARVFGTITSTLANPALTAGDTIIINGVEIAVPAIPNNTVAGLAAAINSATVPNTQGQYLSNLQASVNNGLLTISVLDIQAADEFNRLSVLPGLTGTAYSSLGFDLFAYTQTITSPNPTANAKFGSAVFIDSEADNLVVGAPGGNLYEPVTFDSGTTYFDDRATIFSSTVTQSGVVYTFDYLPSANGSIANPGAFVFGQQVYDLAIASLDQWGTAVNYTTGRLLIGSPGSDLGDSSLNYGRVAQFNNPTKSPAWVPIHTQQPVVDVHLLNGAFMYDRLQSTTTQFFDYINPLQGKILGAARQNIDYISSIDPAKYNVGTVNNNGNFWAADQVGQIWWDIRNVRFIDPNQDDIVYASRRWSQVFPGSQIEVYQWIVSDVPPAQYAGAGTVFSTDNYVVSTRLTAQGTFATQYYYWVKGIDTIDTAKGKTLSTTGIARYIESPRSSGIPYIAVLNASTVAIYNGLEYISAADTILHIDYDRELTDDNIHVEYELIAQDKPNSFLSSGLYRKLQDSFCGVNTVGAQVPDPNLSPAELYGVQFRPRQSMFVDRFLALQNYLIRVNNILINYPIVETRNFTLLNSSEPEPSAASGEWDRRLINLDELSYQDLNSVPLGYRYLIVSDSSNAGLWTIYTVQAGSPLLGSPRYTQLSRVQTYDTRKYWYHTDWYQLGYNSSIVPIVEVPIYASLATLTLAEAPIGSSVKVTTNAQGKFEIYLRTDLGWDRVGLQDGTIQFSEELWNYSVGRFGFDVEVFDAQYFDQEPVIETRKIIQAINEELFVGDLLIERNRCLILMFEFILTELQEPEWLSKTSLVDVTHNIRELIPFQVYRQDNQDFVLNYIQEVKPYHVQIREFNLVYNGLDSYQGMLTDYDVPAYYNFALDIPQYVSPILLPYTKSTAVGTGLPSSISDTQSDAQIWLETPWKFWFNNYLLNLQSVEMIDGGVGYTEPPTVIFGKSWQSNTTYDIGEQVFYNTNLYTVIVSGTTGSEAPQFNNGSQSNGTTTLAYVGTPATGLAVINSAGQVISIDIVNSGSGYSTTPVITIVEGNGLGARAYAVMGNDLVRSISTTIKYDRYQYFTTIVEWQPNVSYDNGTDVRYLGQVWKANSTDSSAVDSATFDPQQWLKVSAGSLSGVDRTMGFYTPTPNMPGLDLPLLIDGVEYPGVQVMGVNFNQNTGYDVGNFDINPYDNVSYGPEGRPTYDPGILDAIYGSSYLDLYLGTRPTDINVDGGGYIDVYSSYAPEELVPGSEFDTLDFRVYTTPGSDYTGAGHGFPASSRRYVYDSANPVLNFAGLLNYPMTVTVFNVTLGTIIEPVSYDWANYELTVGATETDGDVIAIYVTGVGGGNQLYLNTYLGNDIGNTIVVPFPYSSIYEFLIYNGETVLESGVDYTYTPRYSTEGVPAVYNADLSSGVALFVNSTIGISIGSLVSGAGFSSQQTVVGINSLTQLTLSAAPDSMPGTVLTFYPDTGSTTITFDTTYGATDRINLATFGYADPSSETSGWSLPVYQTEVSDGSPTITLTNSMQGTNPVNLIVTVNGLRAKPSAGIKHVGDGTETTFDLPSDCGYSQGAIANNDVSVFVNNEALVLGTEFNLDVYDGSTNRTVTLTSAPALDDQILIAVRTDADYWVSGNQLTFQGTAPTAGDIIEIVTWNDTSEQDILTTLYSADGTSQSFDISQTITDPERILVTVDGAWLFNEIGYTVSGTTVVLTEPVTAGQIIVITSFTESVVPGSMAFRIFQDMRGAQAVYRMTPSTTTTTVANPTRVNQPEVLATDDIIYVEDASALSEPNVVNNIWGIITINGERIMYRERNTTNNTVSSLLRGTAGTAAASHAVGAQVYDMGQGNLLPLEYQNYAVKSIFFASGTQTTFVTDIDVGSLDSTTLEEAVEVYLYGIYLQPLSGYSIVADTPVSIEFDIAPPENAEVAVIVRRGVTWYAPGAGTPSDGVPLQDTNTQAARFLRGL